MIWKSAWNRLRLSSNCRINRRNLMALLENRLRKAEGQLGTESRDIEVYKGAYKKYIRGDDDGEALNALPPYKPAKGAPTLVELIILAIAEVRGEAELRGEKFISRFTFKDSGAVNSQP
jgi:hypothetical protein